MRNCPGHVYAAVRAFLEDTDRNSGIEGFKEKVRWQARDPFLRPALISHLVSLFRLRREEAQSALDQWLEEEVSVLR